MKEIFKNVPGYEGIYQVSNLGNVKSLSREIVNGKSIYISKDKILKSGFDKDGYCLVVLYKNKKRETKRIHQLVAMAFLGHKPNGVENIVDHIDNKKNNNNLNNLQIISNRLNNSKDKKNATSKYIGVSWDKKRNKWLSCISIKTKSTFLGYFINELEASEAYQNKLKTL